MEVAAGRHSEFGGERIGDGERGKGRRVDDQLCSKRVTTGTRGARGWKRQTVHSRLRGRHIRCELLSPARTTIYEDRSLTKSTRRPRPVK